MEGQVHNPHAVTVTQLLAEELFMVMIGDAGNPVWRISNLEESWALAKG